MIEIKHFDIAKKSWCKKADTTTIGPMQSEYFFDTRVFNELHYQNAQNVYEINIWDQDKYISRFFIGLRDGEAMLPYSAPFQYFSSPNKKTFEQIQTNVLALDEILKLLDVRKATISPPPVEYDLSWLAYFNNRLQKLESIMLKHYELNNFQLLSQWSCFNDYFDSLSHSVRKNFRKSEENKLTFECTEASFQDAYNVIEKNREQQGYPLKVSPSQMDKIFNRFQDRCQSFVVKHKDLVCAGAICFHITKDCAQVIYWGDLRDKSKLGSMACLVVNLTKYYIEKEFRLLDIGPSSLNGEPNEGLIRFKTNNACHTSLKPIYEWKNERL
ncbi:MAG: hypothetical protein AB8E15_02715 [Bdellovibrionales bacterium]